MSIRRTVNNADVSSLMCYWVGTIINFASIEGKIL